MKNLLPNRLSDCIDVALKDLDAAKKLGFKVDMSNWYTRNAETCTVCLAGAVLAREFDLNVGEDVGPFTLFQFNNLINHHDYLRLHSLNSLRVGDVDGALAMMDGRYCDADTSRYDDSFDTDISFRMKTTGFTDTKQWRKDMNNIAKYLREKGL